MHHEVIPLNAVFPYCIYVFELPQALLQDLGIQQLPVEGALRLLLGTTGLQLQLHLADLEHDADKRNHAYVLEARLELGDERSCCQRGLQEGAALWWVADNVPQGVQDYAHSGHTLHKVWCGRKQPCRQETTAAVWRVCWSA